MDSTPSSSSSSANHHAHNVKFPVRYHRAIHSPRCFLFTYNIITSQPNSLDIRNFTGSFLHLFVHTILFTINFNLSTLSSRLIILTPHGPFRKAAQRHQQGHTHNLKYIHPNQKKNIKWKGHVGTNEKQCPLLNLKQRRITKMRASKNTHIANQLSSEDVFI